MNTLVLALLAAAPVVPPAPKWSPPAVQVRSLASGAKVWVVPQHTVPLVHVAVFVAAGSIADPEDKAGLANVTTTAIEECGSGERTGEQVRAAFDALGVSLQTETMAEGSSVLFTSLTPSLPAALTLVGELLARPRFEPKDFEGLHARLQSELTSALDEPRFVVNTVMLRELYGNGPRNHQTLGTTEGLQRITLADAKRLHEERWGSANVTFVMVGDVEPDAAKVALDKAMPKSWGRAAQPVVLPTSPSPARWVGLDKPDVPQTVLIAGRLGPPGTDPGLPALTLANTVLGGSFTSRLVQNLREKHGYTYGISSGVIDSRESSRLQVASSLKTEVTGVAVKELLMELENAPTLTDAEFARAQALKATELVDTFSFGEGVLWELQRLIANGLPPDTLTREQAARLAATLSSAREQAALFKPAGWTFVLLGDRKKIQKTLPLPAGTTIEWRTP